MLSGYALIIGAAACWALIGLFSSPAFSGGANPMEISFWRALIAWFFFGAQAFIRKETRLEFRDLPLLIIFGLLGIGLFYVSYLYSIQHGGAAVASVLLYTAPAWVVTCSFIFYREKLTPNKILAIAMVVTGVYLISESGGNANATSSVSALAVISGLTAGFCYSLYYTIGKHFSSRYSSANLFFYMLPIGAAGVFPFVEFTSKNALAWAGIFLIAIVSTFVANQFYYHGLKRLEAGKASIIATIEPVLAAVIAFMFLGEKFTLAGYLGASMIIAAVLLTIMKK